MTPAIQIISRLNDRGVTIRVEGQNLVVTPKSKVPADLIAELPQLKPDLMDLLGKMCFCQPPMPPADIEAPACQHCNISCWCTTCGGCRWCAFQARWQSRLEPKYQ